MDLPGKWTIQVAVRVQKAQYNNGAITEIPAAASYLDRDPANDGKNGYAAKEENMFETFMYIHTFCNPNDPPGGAACKQ